MATLQAGVHHEDVIIQLGSLGEIQWGRSNSEIAEIKRQHQDIRGEAVLILPLAVRAKYNQGALGLGDMGQWLFNQGIPGGKRDGCLTHRAIRN